MEPPESIKVSEGETGSEGKPVKVDAPSAKDPGDPRTIRGLQLYLVIAALFCGVFVMALDETIISTAVPKITTEFKSLSDIAWYGSGYLLTITAFQPTFGKLYRFVDNKLVFMTCVLIFEVGSILCASSPSSTVFIVGRAIAGTGAAGLFQGALAVITKTVELQKRPLFIGIITSTFAISVSIGPVIGGVFSDKVTWRWCFWINVPIGGVVLVLIFFLLHLPTSSQESTFNSMTLPQKLWSLDPLGSVFIISAVVSILLALQWGGTSMPWHSATVIGLLTAFPVLLGLFCFTQWKLGENATLPLALLHEQSLMAAVVYCFFFSVPTYVYGYYISIYFQAAKGFTATESGTRFLAFALPQVIFLVVSGALVTLSGFYVPIIMIGTAIALIASGLILLYNLETPVALWASVLVICGIGTGSAVTLPYTIVQATLVDDDVPTGNAALQFVFQLGAALSLSISQSIFLGQLKEYAKELTPFIPYDGLVAAGASNLRAIAETDQDYNLLRQVYMGALHKTYFYPVVAIGLALLTTFAMEHRNIKNIRKERVDKDKPQPSTIKES
ncbi:efflux pump antibiotic resistance protein [Xylaria bambusicola]|uniref:efflux pump antibiotic resistance protein n=1 Tax=Xylaria bambusicola TaxID=326684 RepID=UPI0020078696|nr:efflux pump antibiotic resistance protein [Xylaria bambusicola]KAI0521607.1 efflux pump antibiotic resistance protein [Xylaria bambusicola]